MLWCKGDDKQKSQELYEMLQGKQTTIACNDKDLKPKLFTILDVAGEMTLQLAPKYTKTPNKFTGVVKSIYEELAEEFLDEVFINDTILDKETWVKAVSKKQSYLFHPKQIRSKLNISN